MKENKDLLDSYVAENFKESAPNKTKFWRKPLFRNIIAASFSLIMVVAITLLAVLLPKDFGSQNPNANNTPASKKYLDDKNVMVECDMTALDAETEYLSLSLDTTKITVFDLVYNSVYNDNLYFLIIFEDDDAFEYAILHAVINKDYTYKFEMPQDAEETHINGFHVAYSESFTEDSGVYLFESIAVITTNKEIIYVNYESYSYDEQSNFLNWIQQSIPAK